MLQQRGQFRYGDSQADIATELAGYSASNGYPAGHFAEAVCATCAGRAFRLRLDDEAGAAVRDCAACGSEHAIGDGAEYLADADLGECECPCGGSVFEIIVGVALYEGSEDVRWLYLGCRCAACGLTACYGDWKNEYIDYRELLSRV